MKSTPLQIDAAFSPAEQPHFASRPLRETVCVVFDVLRATSVMVTALGNGAESLAPAGEIEEALAWKQRDPERLLAGEREGLRITADMTGGTNFDLGNSPAEFTVERVHGRRIVTTTTNGTRALRACEGAGEVLVGSFLNLSATVRRVRSCGLSSVLLVGSGTGAETALEDILAVGAAIEELQQIGATCELSDAAFIAWTTYRATPGNLAEALSRAKNGRRLRSMPLLAPDVDLCAALNSQPLVVRLEDGEVRAQRMS